MDPLSQAITGAAFAGCFARKKLLRAALIVGGLAGMAPDLDVLIRSTHDPLLQIEYHRHFTHSLAFSPFGGLICALFFYLFPTTRKHLSFTQCWLFSFLGLFTHGLLDACTGYGTHVLWPFSAARESWNFIGIIDPLYTLPALLILIIASIRSSYTMNLLSMICMLGYLSLGAWQHSRAETITENWLTKNNQVFDTLTLRPTPGNLWLWRIIYHDLKTDSWQTHALYIPYWEPSNHLIKRGEAVARFTDEMLEQYPAETTLAKDIRRFKYFSGSYLSLYSEPNGNIMIGDVRYSMTPESTQPLWAIVPSDSANEHVEFKRFSRRGVLDWEKIATMLQGIGFTTLDKTTP